MAKARAGQDVSTATPGGGFGGRPATIPTGRGGGQDREWYRGNPIGFNDLATFTRRANCLLYTSRCV